MDETTTTAPPAPYLLYENASAALAWLATAFGFTETLRFAGPDGAVRHAEMRCGGGVVMLGQPADYQSPKRSGHRCSLVVVTVDDVDAHFAHAKAAGATIVSEPEDKPYGDRMYSADDPEGQRWFFSQPVRTGAPEEWGAVRASA